MSTTINATTAHPAAQFSSLAALRAQHSELLKREHENGDTPPFLSEVIAFVRRGQATGALLESDADRWAVQSLLDYWTTVLYRAGEEPPEAALAEFDPNLAPKLDDSLCPYLGLDAFQERNRDSFYGRQRLINELVAQLEEHRFLAVIGPSGSGKSSLVRAGLVPALKSGALPGSQHWRCYPPIVPGSDPLLALARMLHPADTDDAVWDQTQIQSFRENPNHLVELMNARGDVPAVLLVDQFEELFTLCDDNETRQAFGDNLLGLIQAPGLRHTVILTLRSDFEMFIARLPGLQPLFEQAQVRVTPLNASDLREAIEKPAEMAGLKFEAGVIDALLQDILGEPAGLPLLQFTLLKLWENRERNRVTLEVYRQLGGGRLALARSADNFYKRLIPEEQATAKRMLLRMIRPSDGLEVTSNRVRREALYQSGEAHDRVDRVLEKLIRERLVRLTEGETPNDSQVEVAHEALVRNWPALVDWLADERTAITTRRRLETKAAEWERLGKGRGGLLDEIELHDAERWLASAEATYLGYNDTLAALVKASQSAQKKQLAQQRRNTRLRFGAVITIAGLIIGTLGLLLWNVQREVQIGEQRAEAQATVGAAIEAQRVEAVNAQATAEARRVEAVNTQATAEARRIEAEAASVQAKEQARLARSRQLASQAVSLQDDQPDLALLLSIEAHTITDTVEARDNLLKGLQANRPIITSLRGHTGHVRSVAFTSDGKILASGSSDNTIILWNVATGQPIGHPLTGSVSVIWTLAFSPDGTVLASGGCGNFNPEGACTQGDIRLWDVATQQQVALFANTPSNWINSVAFSPDGKTLASGSDDKTVVLWDVAKRQPLAAPLTGHTKEVYSVAFSPDGKTLASGSFDKTIRLWDVAKRRPLATPLTGHTREVYTLAFSPDGKTLASGSYDNTIILWDVSTSKWKQLGQPLTAHTDVVRSIVFSPDGRTLISGSDDKTILLWSVERHQPVDIPIRQAGAVYSIALSSNGRMLASAGADTAVVIRDFTNTSSLGHLLTLSSNHLVHTGPSSLDHGTVWQVAFSPHGNLLASANNDKTITLWEVVSRQPFGRPLKGHTDIVNSVAFSPDGKTLASGSADKTIILWDVATQQPLGAPLTGHTAFVWDVVFSPDGKMLASSDGAGGIILWDVATRQQIGTLTGHTKWVNQTLFTPDGKTLVSASDDGKIIFWDVATRKVLGQRIDTTQGVNQLALTPDGQILAAAYPDGSIQLLDMTTRSPIGDALIGHKNAVLRIAFSPDGRTLASGSSDQTIILWDIATRKMIGTPLRGHRDRVRSVAFSPDGKILVSGGEDSGIIAWDVATGRQAGLPFIPPVNPTPDVGTNSISVFSPDGRILAEANTNGTIAILDIKAQRQLGPPLANTGNVNSLAFNPKRNLLAASVNDTIVLWDVPSYKLLGQIPLGFRIYSLAFSPDDTTIAVSICSQFNQEDHTCGQSDIYLVDSTSRQPQPLKRPITGYGGVITSLTFSPDGTLLASGGDDRTLIIWDVAKRQRLGTPLNIQAGKVQSIAFSPDGKTLASGSADGIILWDVATRQKIGSPLMWHGTSGQPSSESSVGIQSIAFSADGQTLASAIGDQRIVLWDVSVEGWQSRACTIAARNMNWDEWKQYLPDIQYHPTCPNIPLYLAEQLKQADTYAQAGDKVQALASFNQVLKTADAVGVAQFSANVCWLGSIDTFAQIVLPACERALTLASSDADRARFHSNRGLARALAGNTKDAIDDFQAFVAWVDTNHPYGQDQLRREREKWIQDLKAGRNPFTPEVLESIRNE